MPPPDPTKNYLQNDSNFQAVAHIQIILKKPNTSLATEMRNDFNAGYIFISTHPTPTT